MQSDAGSPKVHDRVLLGDREYEIRAIIVAEGSVILVEAEADRESPRVWVLRDAAFAPVAEGDWDVRQYSSFERADGPETEHQ